MKETPNATIPLSKRLNADDRENTLEIQRTVVSIGKCISFEQTEVMACVLMGVLVASQGAGVASG